MYLNRYLLLLIIIVNTKSETFDDFYQYVTDTLTRHNNYVLPTNNEASIKTKTSSIKSYGNYDFIIIGGGSAGSVLTGRLSEVKEWKILLLEAGDNQTIFSDIPGLSSSLASSEMNWGYYTTPQTTACQGMKNNSCVYPRGKVLGGCAVINAVVNSRGISADFDKWADLGNIGWSYKDVLPYFKKNEHNEIPNLNSFYHGKSGPIHVNHTSPPSVVADTFLNGNIQNGLPEIDYNGKGIHGVSRIQFDIRGNKRHNSAHAFLDYIDDQTKVTISLNSFVTKILIKDNQAYAVEFIKDGQTYTAYASKEVILSAGAINSPQILMLSGIGPAKQLLPLGIPVKMDLPAVGKNMQDHVMFVNFYLRINQTAQNFSLYENLQRYINGQTPFTNGAGLEQIAFINTKNNNKNIRNVEFITMPPPVAVPNDPGLFYNFKDGFAIAYKEYNPLTDMFVAIVLLKPKSRGSVTLKSNSPIDFPNIDVNYYSDPYNYDIETIYQGIKYLLTLPQTEAFKKVNGQHVGIQPECEHFKKICKRAYWYCAIRRMSSTIFHPVGTTRMGTSIKNSVVDSDLKVHNMKNLRVVDAGVMPDIISGHPNDNVYMIAEKISDTIKRYHGVQV